MSEQKQPLWEVIQEADGKVTSIGGPMYAAEIRAVRDWLVPKEPQEEPYVNTDLGWMVNTDNAHRWAERQRLRNLLTTEADRAERGDHPTRLNH